VRGRVLHLAPHPDDEVLGAGATLMALRDAGWEVVSLACGLGRPADHARRRTEAAEACRRARFTLRVLDPPLALSRHDDLAAAEDALAGALGPLLDDLGPAIVVSPSPHDRHHGHEAVARAARRALEARPLPAPAWWLWGLWADLPLPTLLVPFGRGRLREVRAALAAHAGEVARADYPALLEARARAGAVLGPERVFGFGAGPAAGAPYADILTELVRTADGWRLGRPRVLAAAADLAPGPAGRADPAPWLDAPSLTTLMGPPG
jgi:LmbE family N-acetylglucosaminyl deacetylase